jgi:hypothetical protein
MTDEIHFQKSTLREKIVEHVFVGEVLRSLWQRRIVDAEILRSEFDAFGYDLVLERGGITRHIQLKAGLNEPDRIGVAEALAKKKSGCVIYVRIDGGLNLLEFYWFSADGSRMAEYPLLKRTRPNSDGVKVEREGYRRLPRAAFGRSLNFSEIVDKLIES